MRVPLGRFSQSLRQATWLIFLGPIFGFTLSAARAQSPVPSSPTPPSPPPSQQAAKPGGNSPGQEMATVDTPATFKFSVNYVLVRVVVRDRDGKVVKNLKKEDFRLTDNRKPQIISTFAAETPASHVPTVKMDPADIDATGSVGAPVKAPELPSRFITLLFDDLHLSTQDAMLSRQAALKLLGVKGTGDRISVFTTSGQVELDYTADYEKLEEALQRVVPRPLMQMLSGDCPPMTFYEAYQIAEANDPIALQVAMADAASCVGSGKMAEAVVQAAASRQLSMGEAQLNFTYKNIESLIRRMTSLPGQRIIILMSPGFFVTPSMRESGEIIDRATKANIVVNTIDARGLYTSSLFDVSNSVPNATNPQIFGQKSQFIITEESLQDDALAEIADGTGGLFFHNRNDIDQGLLQAAAEPEVSYVLGFAPQNLKLNGSYHHLKVALAVKQKFSLQARHGYFAPRGTTDPEAAAKEEIERAVFSQEEMHEVPVECQTQFFKSENGVRLSVVTHVTTTGLKFRKAEDRSNDNVVVSTAIFDENGNLLTGQQKTVFMKLRDITLGNLNKRGGFNVKSSFDLQPGTFLVRVVVRDSEGAQMGAVNRGVVIP